MLLICILDKIGTFGMLRFCLGIFPDASQWATPVVVVLALISIVYGALVAIGQDDVLRLIGLTSLSHFGFIVLGIFVLNANGMSGSILYMVAHGIGTAMLFLVAGYLIRRTGTPLISRMGGQEKVTPVLAGMFLVAGLAAAGLPGSGAVRRRAARDHLRVRLRVVGRCGRGDRHRPGGRLHPVDVPTHDDRPRAGGPGRRARGDLDRREVGAVAPLLVGLLLFGFYPMPLLDVINPYVDGVLAQVGVDPEAPTVPLDVAAEGGDQ